MSRGKIPKSEKKERITYRLLQNPWTAMDKAIYRLFLKPNDLYSGINRPQHQFIRFIRSIPSSNICSVLTFTEIHQCCITKLQNLFLLFVIKPKGFLIFRISATVRQVFMTRRHHYLFHHPPSIGAHMHFHPSSHMLFIISVLPYDLQPHRLPPVLPFLWIRLTHSYKQALPGGSRLSILNNAIIA